MDNFLPRLLKNIFLPRIFPQLILFWWVCIFFYVGGAYEIAEYNYGWFIGILSAIAAIVLPISTIYFWHEVFFGESDDTHKSNSADSDKPYGNANGYKYLELLSSLIAKVAKVDGRVDMTEIQAAEEIFDQLGLTKEQKYMCIQTFRHSLHNPTSVTFIAVRMVSLGFSYEMRLITYEILWNIVCADGVFSEEERMLLINLEKSLQLDTGTFQHFYRLKIHHFNTEQQEYQSENKSYKNYDSLADEYNELNCTSKATNEELQKAYRTLAKKYHPDILRAQGMPESLLNKANEKMARINNAWQKIKKARGING